MFFLLCIASSSFLALPCLLLASSSLAEGALLLPQFGVFAAACRLLLAACCLVVQRFPRQAMADLGPLGAASFVGPLPMEALLFVAALLCCLLATLLQL